MLVEARPRWYPDYSMNYLVCYPQIVFEPIGLSFRGDAEEVERFGSEDFESLLTKAVRLAHQRYCDGKRGLTFERIESGVVHDGYRLPPRVYARRTIYEIEKNFDKEVFYLRYVSDYDKELALDWIGKLHRHCRAQKRSRQLGSHAPTVSIFYDVGATLRGLMKIGLNLVAAVCGNTPVDQSTFLQVIRLIRGDMQVTPPLLQRCGFVRPEAVACIAAAGSHSFQLTHAGGHWHVYSSFFGGRIASYVMFPGPNKEDWRTANVVAPVKSKDWRVTTSRIAQPMGVNVEWRESAKIVPTIQLLNPVSELQVSVVRRRRKAASKSTGER
jgi:hypothetical protein